MLGMQKKSIRQVLRKCLPESNLLLCDFFERLSGNGVEGAHSAATLGIGEVSEFLATFMGVGQEKPSALIGLQSTFSCPAALLGLPAGVVIQDTSTRVACNQF